jgi:hypothetical protein
MHDPQPSFPPALPDLPDDQSWFIHYVGENSRALNSRLDEEDGEDQLVGRLANAIGQNQVRLVAATQAALNQACQQLPSFSPTQMRLLGECIIAAMLGSQSWMRGANAGPCGGRGGGGAARSSVALTRAINDAAWAIQQSDGCCEAGAREAAAELPAKKHFTEHPRPGMLQLLDAAFSRQIWSERRVSPTSIEAVTIGQLLGAVNAVSGKF